MVFLQWLNQSFNALVNYTNRNAKSSLTTNQMMFAYVSATASALVTSIGLKNYLATTAPPFFQRLVPFAAVAAANCVNIPLMRQVTVVNHHLCQSFMFNLNVIVQVELLNGIDVMDDNGNVVTQSKLAPVKGISQVVFSRIFMCAPGMVVLPFIMERLEKYRWMQRITYLHCPIQVMFVGGL